jgi:putative spermidine/putrescine transport system substrate-binding protein
MKRLLRVLGVGGLAIVVMLTSLLASGKITTQAQGGKVPAFPAKPVTLQIIDVAGQKQLTGAMIDNYVKANPDKVSSVEYITDTAPNLPGRIKAQIDGGKIDTALVLSGYDGVASGMAQGNWLQLLPDFNDKFPGLNDNYLPGAKIYNDLAKGFAVCVVFTPSGPLIEYDPSQVETPPKNIDELKAWIKANPNKFIYARPANSGPGRTFLMGLPYLLGDKDPQDPVAGWDKTWAFLKEIDASIEYYPSRTGDVVAELANGTRAMMASTMGWDINPRVLGNMPPDYKTAKLDGTTFVSDAQFVMIPKGLDNDRLAVVLDLMAWMLKPDQQAIAYDKGYFYPGPAVKNVTASMAPADSQKAIKDFGRPEYDDMALNTKVVLPLNADNLVKAFAKWDKEVGQNKVKAAPTAVPPTATPAK